MSAWDAITFERIAHGRTASPVSATTAAAVSSQDVSIPRMSICSSATRSLVPSRYLAKYSRRADDSSRVEKGLAMLSMLGRDRRDRKWKRHEGERRSHAGREWDHQPRSLRATRSGKRRGCFKSGLQRLRVRRAEDPALGDDAGDELMRRHVERRVPDFGACR